jgi:hypothetical protein
LSEHSVEVYLPGDGAVRFGTIDCRPERTAQHLVALKADSSARRFSSTAASSCRQPSSSYRTLPTCEGIASGAAQPTDSREVTPVLKGGDGCRRRGSSGDVRSSATTEPCRCRPSSSVCWLQR